MCSALPAQTDSREWCRVQPRPELKTLKRIPVPDQWFEVFEVAAGVYAIDEPHQSEETISYLIVGTKRAMLFDTGMGISNLKELAERLTRLPIAVLNSHTHNDHVGDNWRFQRVYGMDTAFSKKNAQGSRKAAQDEIGENEICGSLPTGFDTKSYATLPWKVTNAIQDGAKIDLGGRTLEVLSTPGHTPDALCLFDREAGLLFTGDTYYPAAIWLSRPETDLNAYGASIRRLAALMPAVKKVLGAHNIPVQDPAVLARLVAAFDKVRAGKIAPAPGGDGKVLYKVDGIEFLMRPPESSILKR